MALMRSLALKFMPPMLLQVTNKHKMMRNEATADIQNLKTNETQTVHMYGDGFERRMQLYLGDREKGGQMLAYGSRRSKLSDSLLNHHTYDITVFPNVDFAFCALMGIAYDALWNDD